MANLLQLLRPHPAGRRSWTILQRLMLHLCAAGVLLMGCGVVYWRVEPHTPTFADGLWLAFVTASTIGYGDIVPSTHASRIFSVLVVLLGFGILSLVTAAIAATFVESQERRIEREILHDLHRQIRAVRDELAQLRDRLGERTPPEH
jgi:voltage-gated potassium channel